MIRDWSEIGQYVQATSLKSAAEKYGITKEAVRSGVRRFKERAGDASMAGVATSSRPDLEVAQAEPTVGLNGRPERRLIVPDAHIPAHDKKAWEILLAVCRDYRPHKTIIMGDLMDTASLSHHPKRQPNEIRLRDETDATNACLDDLQNAGCGDTYYLQGNHEFWSAGFEAENPQLEGCLDLPTWLHLKERKIRWVTLREQDDFKIGPVAYLHGVFEGQTAARKHAEVFGPKVGCRYVTFAHIHNDDVATSASGYTARCSGFLGDERQSAFGYRRCRPSPWTLGFRLEEVSGSYVADIPVRISNGKALVNGYVY